MLKQKLEKSNLFKSENMNYKTVSHDFDVFLVRTNWCHIDAVLAGPLLLVSVVFKYHNPLVGFINNGSEFQWQKVKRIVC